MTDDTQSDDGPYNLDDTGEYLRISKRTNSVS